MTKSLIKVAVFSDAIEAHIVRGKLEAAGIETFVHDEHLVGVNWFYSYAIGGVKLLVPSSQYKEALDLLR